MRCTTPNPSDTKAPVGPDQFGELAGQRQPLAIVLAGLPRVETDVLQQQDVPVGQTLGTGPRIAADDVVGQLHVLAQLLTQCRGDRRQRQFQVGFALGPSQMRRHHDLGAGVGQRLQRGHRGDDAAGIGDRRRRRRAARSGRTEPARRDPKPLAPEGLYRFGIATATATCRPARPDRRGGWSNPTRCRTRTPPWPGCRSPWSVRSRRSSCAGR